jgi:hypothetical protein
MEFSVRGPVMLPVKLIGRMIRTWLIFLKNLFANRRNPTSRRNLLGMYFGENNNSPRRKPNRDRA